MEWFRLEGILEVICFHPLAMGRVAIHQIRLPRDPSNLAMNTCRDGAPTARSDTSHPAALVGLCRGRAVQSWGCMGLHHRQMDTALCAELQHAGNGQCDMLVPTSPETFTTACWQGQEQDRWEHCWHTAPLPAGMEGPTCTLAKVSTGLAVAQLHPSSVWAQQDPGQPQLCETFPS